MADLVKIFIPVNAADVDVIKSSNWQTLFASSGRGSLLTLTTSKSLAVGQARVLAREEEKIGHVVSCFVKAECLVDYLPPSIEEIDAAEEYWVDTSDLANFNRIISGKIELCSSYGG